MRHSCSSGTHVHSQQSIGPPLTSRSAAKTMRRYTRSMYIPACTPHTHVTLHRHHTTKHKCCTTHVLSSRQLLPFDPRLLCRLSARLRSLLSPSRAARRRLMTLSVPASASHSFRSYQQPSSTASSSRHSYHAATPPAYYDYDAPQQQQLAVNFRRRVEESTHSKHAVNAAVAASTASSSSSSSFSPLSLCSSVSSCSSSSSGSSSSAYSSPADTFDLEEMGEDANVGQSLHHSAYFHPQHQQPHTRHSKQAPSATVKPSRPHPSTQHPLHHPPPPQEHAMYYQTQAMNASPTMHSYVHNSHSPPPSMTVSIPAANGGWKEAPNGAARRREAQLPQAHQLLSAELPPYLPAPMQPVVAAAAEVVTEGKGSSGNKKKGRSLRRCMDREKHSKAEQKRRGEMKMLFDQLQDISQCVYKDRIHILTLAIQTIQRQQDSINQLQEQVKDGKGRSRTVKKELTAVDGITTVESSGYSSPSSSVDSSGSKRAAAVAELDCQPATLVKQEDGLTASTPKKQRISPQPRTVVDLSNDAAFSASLPSIESSTVSSVVTSYIGSSKPLHNSFSSSSLSTYVCSSVDGQGHFPYLMEEPHTQYHAQHVDEPVVNKPQLAASTSLTYPTPPGMSPVFSFTAHPQHWWPSSTEVTKH